MDMWDVARFGTSPFLFNICCRVNLLPWGEVSVCSWTSIAYLHPGDATDARLQGSSKITKGTLARLSGSKFCASGSGTLPSLLLELLQTDMMHNLGVLLDSRLLLKEEVALMVRMAFVHACVVHQLHSFLDPLTLLIVTHALVTFVMCYIHGIALEKYPET